MALLSRSLLILIDDARFPADHFQRYLIDYSPAIVTDV
jgi:hypothetical protein